MTSRIGDANVILSKSSHCLTFPLPDLNTDIWAKRLLYSGNPSGMCSGFDPEDHMPELHYYQKSVLGSTGI